MCAPNSVSIVPTTSAMDRKYCRGEVAIAGTVRVIGGVKCPVQLVDISTTGFQMECLTYIADSQVLFLSIPNFQPLVATIMWQTDWMYGCKFAHPLHTAVFEHIVRSYPSLET